MSSDESSPMTSRSRRAKKFLTPSMKYEIWLQLIRGEATIAQAATAAESVKSTETVALSSSGVGSRAG